MTYRSSLSKFPASIPSHESFRDDLLFQFYRKEAGPNMVHFIRRLRELVPNMIISQPTYGYPQVFIFCHSWFGNKIQLNNKSMNILKPMCRAVLIRRRGRHLPRTPILGTPKFNNMLKMHLIKLQWVLKRNSFFAVNLFDKNSFNF